MSVDKGDFAMCKDAENAEAPLDGDAVYLVEEVVEQNGEQKVKLAGIDGFFSRELFIRIRMPERGGM